MKIGEGRVVGKTKRQTNKHGYRGIRKRERKEIDTRKFILQMKIFPVEFSAGLTLPLNTS
jgi:hypothetical protein